MLPELEQIINERWERPPAESYTARLFAAGEDAILKKVGEEAMEIILAAKGQGKERLVEESADLLYHLLVLWRWHDITLADVEAELRARHRPNQ